jgi:glutamate N-acetyltransferase/amino-acid N-acetyltransferase
MDGGNYRVQGFRASAVKAGLKKKEALDLTLIFSERSATAAGVFTRNQVKAAPVIVSREHLKGGRARAIIANAGNANACTGVGGLENARRTAALAARELGVGVEEILVASTGVIGLPLNMGCIERALPDLVRELSPDGLPLAAQAVMTTDSFMKIGTAEGRAGKCPYRIVGIAKGAGMIMPDMATMLCFVLSDIGIDSGRLAKALRSSVETTFNRISVDGDTSTNDTVFVLANGMAGNGDLDDSDYAGFEKALTGVLGSLAGMIVRDGEGATKAVKVRVQGARSAPQALLAARTVANSALVKTAFYGQDPNWGRILAALGRSGIDMREDAVDIWIDDIQIVGSGLGKGTEAERRAAEKMRTPAFDVLIDLHQGPFGDQVMTCDLTHKYVSINADYRT